MAIISDRGLLRRLLVNGMERSVGLLQMFVLQMECPVPAVGDSRRLGLGANNFNRIHLAASGTYIRSMVAACGACWPFLGLGGESQWQWAFLAIFLALASDRAIVASYFNAVLSVSIDAWPGSARSPCSWYWGFSDQPTFPAGSLARGGLIIAQLLVLMPPVGGSWPILALSGFNKPRNQPGCPGSGLRGSVSHNSWRYFR